MTNVEAEPNTLGSRTPGLLKQQVTAPVRFTDMVERMVGLGVERFLEVGPGSVLSGLIARISRPSRRASLSLASDVDAAVKFIGGDAAGAA